TSTCNLKTKVRAVHLTDRGVRSMAKKLRIEYKVAADAAALAAETAERLTSAAEKAVAERGRVRIAISGGSTPKAAFTLLADPGKPWFKRMPWDKLDLF